MCAAWILPLMRVGTKSLWNLLGSLSSCLVSAKFHNSTDDKTCGPQQHLHLPDISAPSKMGSAYAACKH